MIRCVCAAAALMALGSLGRADQTITSRETIIRLRVQPAAAPRPALRFLLLPDWQEMTPGNPIASYLRCMLDPKLSANSQVSQRRAQLLGLPLDQLPARELVDYGGPALHQVDRAARLDRPDWQIIAHIKRDGIGVLLPDIAQMRTLAQSLQLRFRAEVALRHYPDAIRTAKTLFAMSRHLGEHLTVVGNLVGTAIAFVAIAPLEEMLEQPGCPNFYWALTALPDPLVSMLRGLDGERVLIASQFHELSDTAPMSPTQIDNVVSQLDNLFKLEPPTNPKFEGMRAWLKARTSDAARVRAARRRLVVEYGHPEQLIQQFPPEQVFLVEQWRLYEVHRDELLKFMNLPEWQFEAFAKQIKPDPQRSLFDPLQAAMLRIRRAQGRLEQRIALLRHVEALRLYAADHDGRLPARLSDIAVPLPADPFTGRPFLYQPDGASARLRGSPPAGEEKNAGFNVVYEITIER